MIQVAYASRTGHVKQVVGKLGLTNALKIVKGDEKLDGEYVIRHGQDAEKGKEVPL